MNKPEVLHIVPTPFFADRGCHIRIRNEVEALAAHPYRIIICTYPLGRDVEGLDIRRTWPIPGYTKLDAGYSPFRFIADFFLFFLVLKTAWQERPALLHCHLHEGVLIGWVVKWCLFWRRMTVIMDMQGSLSGELAAYGTFAGAGFILKCFKTVETLICWMPDLFLCSSQKSRDCLINDFKVESVKTQVVQDIVPEAIFTTDRDGRLDDIIPADKTVILYTGSLLPGKGIDHVLEAMRILCTGRNDLFFVLVGYPLDSVEPYIHKHNLTEYSYLPGQVDYGELAGWLAIGNIAIEPKEEDSGEASGKLLHYMAAGLPVVCFGTDNNQQMLGAAGFFASSTDGQRLALAVEEALSDPQQAEIRGGAGRQRIRAKYSSEAVGQILQRVYGANT